MTALPPILTFKKQTVWLVYSIWLLEECYPLPQQKGIFLSLSHRWGNQSRAGDSMGDTGPSKIWVSGLRLCASSISPSCMQVWVCLSTYCMSSSAFIHGKTEASRGENCVPSWTEFLHWHQGLMNPDHRLWFTLLGRFCGTFLTRYHSEDLAGFAPESSCLWLSRHDSKRNCWLFG